MSHVVLVSVVTANVASLSLDLDHDLIRQEADDADRLHIRKARLDASGGSLLIEREEIVALLNAGGAADLLRRVDRIALHLHRIDLEKIATPKITAATIAAMIKSRLPTPLLGRRFPASLRPLLRTGGDLRPCVFMDLLLSRPDRDLLPGAADGCIPPPGAPAYWFIIHERSGDFHRFYVSAETFQILFQSIIATFDVFYTGHGRFSFRAERRDDQRCAAAQILRQKLRAVQALHSQSRRPFCRPRGCLRPSSVAAPRGAAGFQRSSPQTPSVLPRAEARPSAAPVRPSGSPDKAPSSRAPALSGVRRRKCAAHRAAH